MEQARAACLACDHTTPAGHGGTISADAAGENIVHRERVFIDRSPRGQVTNLPQEQEERLAELFRRWVGLDTIDALLALHCANGGTTASFGAYLLRVRDAIERSGCEREAYRATAWAKFQSIVRRFKPFIRGRLQAWSDGHGGAVRKERTTAEHEAAQGWLF